MRRWRDVPNDGCATIRSGIGGTSLSIRAPRGLAMRATMTFFLTTLPLWLSAIILIVPTTLLAMSGPVIVRRYIKVDQLRTNNEVAGFKFATVGVLYAVLLAFAVVVVWEKFNQAESEVAKEAGAA